MDVVQQVDMIEVRLDLYYVDQFDMVLSGLKRASENFYFCDECETFFVFFPKKNSLLLRFVFFSAFK